MEEPAVAIDLAAFTAFSDGHQIAQGRLSEVAVRVSEALAANPCATVLTFNTETGGVVDLDLRGGPEAIRARYADADEQAHSTVAVPDATSEPPRGRGRPKLGVVSREVTLLPRHWDWLAKQQGGASVVIRRLVDAARQADRPAQARRQQQAAAYRFMSAIAGDLAGFEEASRALFANDPEKMATIMADWPSDIRSHALLLAFG